MKRYGAVLGLKPEAVADYVRVDPAVWPDVLRQIAGSNIRNYSDLLKRPDNLLFSSGVSRHRLRGRHGGDGR